MTIICILVAPWAPIKTRVPLCPEPYKHKIRQPRPTYCSKVDCQKVRQWQWKMIRVVVACFQNSTTEALLQGETQTIPFLNNFQNKLKLLDVCNTEGIEIPTNITKESFCLKMLTLWIDKTDKRWEEEIQFIGNGWDPRYRYIKALMQSSIEASGSLSIHFSNLWIKP